MRGQFCLDSSKWAVISGVLIQSGSDVLSVADFFGFGAVVQPQDIYSCRSNTWFQTSCDLGCFLAHGLLPGQLFEIEDHIRRSLHLAGLMKKQLKLIALNRLLLLFTQSHNWIPRIQTSKRPQSKRLSNLFYYSGMTHFSLVLTLIDALQNQCKELLFIIFKNLPRQFERVMGLQDLASISVFLFFVIAMVKPFKNCLGWWYILTYPLKSQLRRALYNLTFLACLNTSVLIPPGPAAL